MSMQHLYYRDQLDVPRSISPQWSSSQQHNYYFTPPIQPPLEVPQTPTRTKYGDGNQPGATPSISPPRNNYPEYMSSRKSSPQYTPRSSSPEYISSGKSSSQYSYYSAPLVQPPRVAPQNPHRSNYGNVNWNGNPVLELSPTSFPPGLDKKVVKAFQAADRDENGFIDEKELKAALASCGVNFTTKTVRFIVNNFTNTKTRMLGPMEFASVYFGLQEWKGIFQTFDSDRNGKISLSELRQALQGFSLEYPISGRVLDLLIFIFDKNGGGDMGIGFEGFIECCLTVKGLTKKFKENDTTGYQDATFTYEKFMRSVLPFIVA